MNNHCLSTLARLAPAERPKGAEPVSAAWTSPSNIAIVKYWGKREGQLPANPSLSLTLSRAVTRTRVTAIPDTMGRGMLCSVNGDAHHPFMEKMQRLTVRVTGAVPWLANYSLLAETENTFPHAAGIASSASGMSAFALCLVELCYRLAGLGPFTGDFIPCSSRLARLGSGSACRSLYGGFVLWGATDLVPGSSDDHAIPVNHLVHPGLAELRDAILVVSSRPKPVSSTAGHGLMNSHPFADGRYRQAGSNLTVALQALGAGDFETLGTLAEQEALALHALIMSSSGGVILMEPATLEAVKRVRAARQEGLPLFFTLDAGPNVHLLYPGSAAATVEPFIRDGLAPLCEEGRVIFDGRGDGPASLNTTVV